MELPGLRLIRRPPLVIAELEGPHRILSSAIWGGGLVERRAVAWLQVRNQDLPVDVDPLALLREHLQAAGRPDAVGLMTSRNMRFVHTASVSVGGVTASAVATVGLSNALRIGDPPGFAPAAGTVNLLVRLSAPLTDAALVEALALAAEARTTAVSASGWASVRTGAPATGTGTDCLVIAAPVASSGSQPLPWCGKHTAAGSALGRAALAALSEGVEVWLRGRAKKYAP